MSEQSFKLGFIMGLLCPSEKRVEKEPVAYLYNGLRFPKLPEYDDKVYQYALIDPTNASMGYYSLMVSEEIVFYKQYNWYFVAHRGKSLEFLYRGTELGWELKGSYDFDPYGSGNMVTVVTWANFDVVDENGDVVLPKSDPIPIYE